MLRTLAGRLTFFYALLFCGLALILFLVIDNSMESYLLHKIDEELQTEVSEFTNLLNSGGIETVSQQMLIENISEDIEEVFIRIFDADSREILATDLSAWPVLPPLQLSAGKERLVFFSASVYPSAIRTISSPLGPDYSFQMGTRLDHSEQLMMHYHRVFAATFVLVLTLGATAGFYLTRKVLLGLRMVREAADRISAGNLSAEIPRQNGVAEVNALIRSVNHMQQRIKALIGELQNVTNNIAHDLRSPLTRMRGMAEMTLTGDQEAEEYRALAGAVVEECDSLVGMINTMLEIAETDAGLKPLELQPLAVDTILQDIAELYSTVAEDREISMSLKIADGPLQISGNRSRLQRAFANLLDNALKFTPDKGRVMLEAGREAGQVIIRFTDNGKGIAAADLPHVCERYYRADRSRSTPGTGLGLSLVQAIIHAHGGELTVTSEDERGTCVTIRLPSENA
ncbi:MAG: hypothetical protein C0622_14095 [Desulfuromonas sp.]|nr:MAG: hypothetical protein C0622_14095 [Desulfuromonas sp.]